MLERIWRDQIIVAMLLNPIFLFLIIVCQLLPSPAFEAMPTSKKPAGVVRAKPAAVVPVSRKGAKGSATSRSDSAAQTRAMKLLISASGKSGKAIKSVKAPVVQESAPDGAEEEDVAEGRG